jgi:hypothetical protein
MMAESAAVRSTPLCYFVTSSPQGGRVEPLALWHSNSKPLNFRGEVGGVPLSPRVGEMSGRTEGGTPISEGRPHDPTQPQYEDAEMAPLRPDREGGADRRCHHRRHDFHDDAIRKKR